MLAGIIAVITFLGQLIAVGLKIWDAIKEKDEESKKQKTAIAQSGVRGLADRDASRIVSSFDELRRLREK